MKSEYLNRVYEEVKIRNQGQDEFLQAVLEVFNSLDLVVLRDSSIEKDGIIERLVEPERTICFRVSWVDDCGKVNVNRGYRVEYNSAIGPFKGGLRFHPSVNLSIIKFLGFEQTFKNALTTLPIGGGKGGSDFDPKGKSDGEIMRFCQSFMTELYRHIGPNTDVPAGDIGVGAREIGYLYGQYKKITNEFVGSLTGKGLSYGGSKFRTEATGFGLCYYLSEALDVFKRDSFENKRVVVSGAGNVAIHAAQKSFELGGKCVAMSDSSGYIYDEQGIDLSIVKEIKLKNRGRLFEYVDKKKDARYYEGRGIWEIDCDIALACATQNELDGDDAKKLIKNGVIAVAEGANMPCTPKAIDEFKKAGVIFGPAKAANAGGVAASSLEMTQNAMHYAWSFSEVDDKIKWIMKSIFNQGYEYAKEYANGMDLLTGSNIAGFLKVKDAMKAQGII